MVNYRLSEEAGDDLDRLYLDRILRFDLHQANEYYDGLV